MKFKIACFFVLFILSHSVYCQENDDFEKRLRGITNNTISFYNVNGIDFTVQTFNYEFNDKDLQKLYRKYKIKESDKKSRDSILNNRNVFITKSEKLGDTTKQISSYYFIENKDKRISVLSFGYFNNLNKEFERKCVKKILEDEIPDHIYESMTIDSIDFVGRKIKLGSNCYWTNVNTVQCPYYGEMNWSIHKTYESARNAVSNQFEVLKIKSGGKIIEEIDIPVIFEQSETTAKKVVYGFTGGKSLLTSVSGGKSLTIYYVAAKVRGNYVSCCMSFWNNDTISESGLAPLLEKLMVLKK